MIKQMERRFAIVAISVISLVLFILIITVNVISIKGNIIRADETLRRIAFEPLPSPSEDSLINPDDEGIKQPPVQMEFGVFSPEVRDKRDRDKEDNRTFSVRMDEDLNFISSNGSEKNIQDEGVSYSMALLAVEDNRQYGFIEDFRYMKVEENQQIRIIFLDYSFEKESERNVMVVSIGAYFVATLLVTGLVLILLKPVMKSIKESYAKQKQFITDASHELKTPLTIISTNMEIIEMENGQSDWIKSVKNQVTRLNTLTNELVTLSRMNEEDSQIVMGEVDVSALIGDVAMGFEPAIIAQEKKLEVAIEDNLILKGHEDSLERVMSILLNNALKYSDSKGSIGISLYKKGKKVILSVINSVDQIERGNHDEFFERFYRSDMSRNSITRGFGIGLAVAKSIIEEHKGKIEARSEDGESLEILITLKA